MRRSIAFTLIGLVAATPLAAQFEGTVTMKMSGAGNGTNNEMTMKVATKNGKTATVMSLPSSSGPMAGMEMRSIYDPSTNTSTTLMPLPPGMGGSMPGMANAKGMKIVLDLSKAQMGAGNASDNQVDVKKLGTSETILGMSCDDYEMKPAKGDAMRMCVTESMGRFLYPQGGGGMGRGRGGSAAPAWTHAFGDKPMFPLKVWSPDGKVAMEVIAIDKSPVPASLFEIPDGYMDMSSMMGGMRPPI